MKSKIMKQYLIILLVLIFCSKSAWAQDEQKGSIQQIAPGMALGNGAVLFNLEYLRTHTLNPANNFRFGYGIRGSQLRSFRAWEYIAAASSEDTFLTENPAISSVNIGFYAAYFAHPLLEIGLYSDIIGISFGPEQDGAYRSPAEEGVPRTVSASPEKFDLLFAAKGSYQTEFFMRYWLGKRVGLKAGVSWYRSVYVTEQAMNHGQRRFSNASLFFNVGLSYRWGAL